MMRYNQSPDLAIAAYKAVAREHREDGEHVLAERAEREARRLEGARR